MKNIGLRKKIREGMPKWIDNSLVSYFDLIYLYMGKRSYQLADYEKPLLKKYQHFHLKGLTHVAKVILSAQLRPLWESFYNDKLDIENEDFYSYFTEQETHYISNPEGRTPNLLEYEYPISNDKPIISNQIWLATAVYSSMPTPDIISSKQRASSWGKQVNKTFDKLIKLFEEIPMEYMGEYLTSMGRHIQADDYTRHFFYHLCEKSALTETDEETYNAFWHFVYDPPEVFDTRTLLMSMQNFYQQMEKNNFFWHPKYTSEKNGVKYYFCRSLTHACITRFNQDANIKAVADITNLLFDTCFTEKEVKKYTQDIIENPDSFKSCLGLLTHLYRPQGKMVIDKDMPNIEDPFCED